MPIYVARAEFSGGVRLEGLEAATNPWEVHRLTHMALAQGVMRLFLLSQPEQTYSLPAEAPHSGIRFRPYLVRPVDVGKSGLPETAIVTAPGYAATNPDPYARLMEIKVPRPDEHGSHIVPIVSSGRGQDREYLENDTWQSARANSLLLRGVVIHDANILDGIEPLKQI